MILSSQVTVGQAAKVVMKSLYFFSAHLVKSLQLLNYRVQCRSQAAIAVVPQLHSSSAEHAWQAGFPPDIPPPSL